jgi:hypothetical protein
LLEYTSIQSLFPSQCLGPRTTFIGVSMRHKNPASSSYTCTHLIILLWLRDGNHEETKFEENRCAYHQVVAMSNRCFRQLFSSSSVYICRLSSLTSTRRQRPSQRLSRPTVREIVERSQSNWPKSIRIVEHGESAVWTYLICDEVLDSTRYSRT